MYLVAIDAAKCEGCEECVNVCLGVCPTAAITITEM